MKCDRCHQNQAAVTLTQTINGVTRDLHLCPACASELEAQFAKHTWAKLFPDNFFGSWLGHTGGIPDFGGTAQQGLTCPSCSTSFADFLKTGLFGCPDCYRAFAPELDGLFRRVQGQTRHVGRGIQPAAAGSGRTAAGSGSGPRPERTAVAGAAATPPDPVGQVTLELQQLKERQSRAVSREDYESAAQCRDEILRLRQRLEKLQAAGSASPAAAETAEGTAAKQKGESL
ncbi:hypothetical protein HCH52_10025 [Oscillospiraceae bacterium HV4-5-C5C]|nr:hypothetical protein [Oscillospiraceae bacterium HV4-5-C5C]